MGWETHKQLRDIHCFVKELDAQIMFLTEITKLVYSKSWIYEVEAGNDVYFGCFFNDSG